MKDTQSMDAGLFHWRGHSSFKNVLPLALQHLVAIMAGCMTPALIVSAAAGLNASDQVILLQMSLIISGLSTLVMVFPIGGRIGARLPVIIGVSFAYIPTIQAVATTYSQSLSPTGAIAIILGSQLVGGAVAIVFGLLIKKIAPLFPSVVSGTVVFVIGLSLYPIAIKYMGGGGAVTQQAHWGQGQNWIVGLLTFLCAFILANFTRGLFKLASVLFAMIFGYLVSIPFGMISLAQVGEASYVSVATPLHFGLRFALAPMISFAVLFIINSIQAIGDFHSTTVGGMDRPATTKELQGGILGYGLTNMLGAFTGCLPTATFSQNVGIVATTKVINRRVFAVTGVLMILAGVFPKISAFLTTIPFPVIGGATLSVFAMITMNGIKLIAQTPLTPRNTVIVGTSVAIGVGFTTVCGEAFRNGVTFLSQDLYTAIGTSPVVLTAITAVVLNQVLKTKPDEPTIATPEEESV